MNYITNEEGEVKVRHENGTENWIPKHLAENKFLMKGQGLTAVEAPVKFESKPIDLIDQPLEPIEEIKSKGGRPKTK